MQNYPADSPEAMAQLLTALMAADDLIDDAEVEALGVLDAYARIGIAPQAFADVLRDYFTGIDAAAGRGDPVDRIAGRITDRDAQIMLWEVMVGLAGADDYLAPAETAFLERVAALWWDGALPARLSMPGARPLLALRRLPAAGLDRACGFLAMPG
ncbi:MAG: TerB family tellurite resistance protein [Betaproteobacteria bacterium]|jgi:uncharacterized tellurite resistance protein B-like protein|nr:TerB family tellurite resistance protein [Betaproteobacteria bacterium]